MLRYNCGNKYFLAVSSLTPLNAIFFKSSPKGSSKGKMIRPILDKTVKPSTKSNTPSGCGSLRLFKRSNCNNLINDCPETFAPVTGIYLFKPLLGSSYKIFN